jgi:EF-hand domain pair
VSRIRSVCGISIAAVLLLAAPAASAQSAATGDSGRGQPAKDTPAANGPEIWDANHDGVYTCDEWKAYLDRLFTLADRNHDGRLDPSEFPVIRKADTTFAEADFAYFDENQDGKITRGEFVDRPSEFILQHDKNGDCRVTPDEINGTSTEQKPAARKGRKF